MPLAKGPFLRFTDPMGGSVDLHIEWGSASPACQGKFYTDLCDPTHQLDPAYSMVDSGTNHILDLGSFALGAVHRYRCENVDASGNMVEETVPASTPFASLPQLPIPPDPAATTVTLSGACAVPAGNIWGVVPPRRLFPPWPYPFPWPIKIKSFLLSKPTAVVTCGKIATLKVRALSAGAPVANIPVTFTIAWGNGMLGPAMTPGASVQAQSAGDGWAVAEFTALVSGQVAIITASSTYDTASVTTPVVFHVFVA
jgi:hypothetical protein